MTTCAQSATSLEKRLLSALNSLTTCAQQATSLEKPKKIEMNMKIKLTKVINNNYNNKDKPKVKSSLAQDEMKTLVATCL